MRYFCVGNIQYCEPIKSTHSIGTFISGRVFGVERNRNASTQRKDRCVCVCVSVNNESQAYRSAPPVVPGSESTRARLQQPRPCWNNKSGPCSLSTLWPSFDWWRSIEVLCVRELFAVWSARNLHVKQSCTISPSRACVTVKHYC